MAGTSQPVMEGLLEFKRHTCLPLHASHKHVSLRAFKTGQQTFLCNQRRDTYIYKYYNAFFLSALNGLMMLILSNPAKFSM